MRLLITIILFVALTSSLCAGKTGKKPVPQIKKITVEADDTRAVVSIEMDRPVPVTTSRTRRGASIFDFKGLRYGKPGFKERPESLLVYSIRIAPRRQGLRVVMNSKHFLPTEAVKIDADYIQAKPPIYRILFLNRLKHIVPKVKKNELTVVIDPGHGGIDPGNLGRTVHEKVITTSVSKKLKALIDKKAGIRAFLTRSNDSYVPLEDRPRVASIYGADLMISIHANAFKGKQRVHGFEIFQLSAKGEKQIRKYLTKSESKIFSQTMLDNFRLSQSIRDKMHEGTDLRDRGVKPDELIVTRTVDFPSILVELGFLTDPSDEKKLKDLKYQDKIAQALLDGIVLYQQRKKAKWRGPARPNRKRRKRRRGKPQPIPKDGYVVKSGDSVSKIAIRFGVTAEAIAKKNKLRNINRLKVGQVLRIPKPAPKPKVKQAPKPLLAKGTLYKVKNGDSVSKLAIKFGITTEAIVKANKIKNANAIKIGQTLQIPPRPKPEPEPFAVPEPLKTN